MRKKIILIVFIIAILIVSILKQTLVYDLPIRANVGLGIDDMLMIYMTNSIANGKWIGGYNDVILSKGVSFPLMLVLCYYLHVDYITMMTLLYTFACLYLTYVLSKKIKNKIILFFIYTLTLFTPIMYSYQVMQRVYRNAIIPSLSIFIIAGYLHLFFTRNEGNLKRKIGTAIGTGFAVAIFWYTREDSIWILPYVLFMSGALITAIFVKNKKITKEFFITILILIIPFIMTFAYKNILSYINYKHFGVYTVYNNKQYNKAMDSLRKVKKYDYYENIDFTIAKLKKVSEVTCLKNIYGRLEGLVYGYSLIDSSPLDGEVANGWFPWAFRGAMQEYGYYQNAEATNNFLYTLHVQIEEALENGTLEKEDVKLSIIERLKKILYETGNVFEFLYAYKDIEFLEDKVEYNQSEEYKYSLYEKYTKNKFLVYNSETNKYVHYSDIMEDYQEKITPKVKLVKQFMQIYKFISAILFTIGSLLYLILTIMTIIGLIKKKCEILEIWVMSSGILGAMLSLVFGIAYETAFNANVITAMYLSAVYPLMIIFGSVMIGYSIIKIIEYLKQKSVNTQAV